MGRTCGWMHACGGTYAARLRVRSPAGSFFVRHGVISMSFGSDIGEGCSVRRAVRTRCHRLAPCAAIRNATKGLSTKPDAWLPHGVVGQTRLPVLCLGQSSCGPCFASQSRRSCWSALQVWFALRSNYLRGSTSDDNWQPPLTRYVYERRHIRGLIVRRLV
jgi:hypothetical protein